MDPEAQASLDLALVRRVLLGEDRQAFNQLVLRHQGTVRALLRRLCRGNAAQADDLAQETFLLAWRKLAQFRAEARFSTWLFRIAHNCFLQAYRQQPAGDRHDEQALLAAAACGQSANFEGYVQGYVHSNVQGDSQGNVQGHFQGNLQSDCQDDFQGDVQRDLQRALEALPEGERLVLLYHAQMGLSHEETADITGLPLGTVKSHATRGKARLRSWLQAYQHHNPAGERT